MAIRLFKGGHQPDYSILGAFLLLTAFGLVILASASSELGKIRFNDSYYYFKHQVIYGLSLGLIGFFLASKIYYRYYQKWAFFLLLLSLVLLALVFTDFGFVAGGAGRWLRFGPLTFQPSEILKLTFIIYLAAWLSNPKSGRDKNFFEGFVPFLFITGLVGGLLVLQPATSIVVILLAAGFIIYFLSGVKMKFIFTALLLGFLGLGIIIYTTSYRLERIVDFFNYGKDIQGRDYHLNEALTTLGSGGLWGIGYGESLSKAGRLPASITDSIFAVIGSELGFVGAGSLIALFAYLTLRIFWLARDFPDRFGRLLLFGFGSIISMQAFINMAAISGLLPLTGIPLPFISYGGSALVVFLTMAGIIVNVSKYA